MNNQLISILMPVKNEAGYLEDCIESILNQSISNWELIAVDDHSTDDSFSILNSYASTQSNIQVIKSSGQGILPALRTAFNASTGSFITRMDADDKMHPQKLERLLEPILLNKNVVTTGLVQYFSDQQVGQGYKNYEDWLNHLTGTQTNRNEIYRECMVASPNWMVERNNLIQIGAFDSDWYPEDYDLCFRMYYHNLKITGIPEITHYWRDSPERTSRTSPLYADPHFYQIKLHYFTTKEVQPTDSIVLWSAGGKSKSLAKILVDHNADFLWLCNNPRKIGQTIYNVKIHDYKSLSEMKNPKILVPVAQEKYLIEIEDYFKSFSLKKNHDYFILG